MSRYIQVVALLALGQGIGIGGQAVAQDQDVVIRLAQRQRLVSREEGAAIAQFTLQRWPKIQDKPDCSHLVHDIYAEAGLDYDYAASSEIFDGVDSFRRVQKSQPGDLVVWRGHMGIVIDPEDNSFYSSVLSGFSVSRFDSSYWLSRGPRRFYRYIINDVQSTRLLERAANGKTYVAAVRSAPYQARFVTNNTDRESKSLDWDAPERGATEPLAYPIRLADPVTPSASNSKPTMDQIRSAFIKLSDSNAQALLESGVVNGPIEIVSSFELGRTETRNGALWVEFKINKIASFADGNLRMSPIHATERVRLLLLMQGGHWTLTDQANRVFLLRQDAVTMIAGRLARLSRSSNTADLKPLTKALEMLLADDRS